MPYYEITIPIAGYAIVGVDAGSEETARDLAFEKLRIEHIEQFEPIEECRGNMCCRPRPWNVEAEKVED